MEKNHETLFYLEKKKSSKIKGTFFKKKKLQD